MREKDVCIPWREVVQWETEKEASLPGSGCRLFAEGGKKGKQLTWAESLNSENFRVKLPPDCKLAALWSKQTMEDEQVRRGNVGGESQRGVCASVRDGTGSSCETSAESLRSAA